MVYKFLSNIQSHLPSICLSCQQRSHFPGRLCEVCNHLIGQNMIQQASQSCIKCALQLSPDNPMLAACAQCQQQAPRFQRCVSATQYNPVTAILINQLKHRHKLGAANCIADFMHSAIKQRYQHLTTQIDLIIAMPLHNARLQQRGFNQALEISKCLSRTLAIPYNLNACKKIIHTAPQQELDMKQRQANLRHAFTANSFVKGKKIALVDDVVTTGATANAATKALLDAGAESCDIWCFARTPAKK